MGWFSVFLFMQGPRTITRDPSAAMPNQLPINGAQICILSLFLAHTHTHHINSHTKSRRNRRREKQRFRHKTRSRIAHGERVITRCGHCLAFYRRWSGLDFGPLTPPRPCVWIGLRCALSVLHFAPLLLCSHILGTTRRELLLLHLLLLPQSIFYQQGKSPFWRKRSCSLNDLQMRFVFVLWVTPLGLCGMDARLGERGDCSFLLVCEQWAVCVSSAIDELILRVSVCTNCRVHLCMWMGNWKSYVV